MVATLAKQARETSDRIYLEDMYGMVDCRNRAPRSTLTKLVNGFRRHYREARLRGFDHANASGRAAPRPSAAVNPLQPSLSPTNFCKFSKD
jgi:hypothetical protein